MPPPNPDWVKALTPSGPQGSELIAKERAQSDINVDQLATFLFTKEVLERNAKILKILQEDPVFDKSQNYFRGRTDRLEAALARGKHLKRLRDKHNWTEEEHHVANDLISEPTPYGLHSTMFLKTLEEQGTPAQHELFLEKARNYEIIGCYAQTELGHGSNVRGLETTATWNPEDKTFTLHSPHLTASKWWIGSLGKAANHAVVVAQLILNGKSYGPHPFVVPIRDMKTHEPLENIHVGDIGPKFGYNTMDNGFLLFNHVKIPHVNMLNRFSGIDPETSKYIRPSNPALIYGTLTFIRSSIVFQSGSVLARGVTIATRYCAVRRQFQDRDADAGEVGENQVLNYTMVQHRLLPLLASAYALHFTGRSMINLYNANQKRMAQGRERDNSKRAPDLRSSALAATTWPICTPSPAPSRLLLPPPLPRVLKSVVALAVAMVTLLSLALVAGTPITSPPSHGRVTTTCSPSKSPATSSSLLAPSSPERHPITASLVSSKSSSEDRTLALPLMFSTATRTLLTLSPGAYLSSPLKLLSTEMRRSSHGTVF
ncbi:hypothetical protein NXS19_002867 [Fusarium pseudograminearum]|nr:hypothetical protein NXS19_002867 [Fusarium pseudograminearum]